MKTIELGFEALDLRYDRLRLRIPSYEAKLFLSLSENGQQNPIIVVSGPADRSIVIDGMKRIRCLKRLRTDVVKAIVWEMDVTEALVLSHQMTSRVPNIFEESWLIYELHVKSRWDMDKLSVVFNRSKSWVSRRLGLVRELPSWMHSKIRNGEIGEYIALKYLVPLARANMSDCEKLVNNISNKNLTTRQMCQLYDHYKSSSRQVRIRLIESPLKFLKAKEETEKTMMDLEFSESENRCIKNLNLIGKISGGLAKTLNKVINYDTGDDMRKKLTNTWIYVNENMEILSRAINMVLKK